MGARRMRARAMTGRSRRRSSERGDAGPGGPWWERLQVLASEDSPEPWARSRVHRSSTPLRWSERRRRMLPGARGGSRVVPRDHAPVPGGMGDILPVEIGRWQALEQRIRAFAERFGFRELRTPVVEHTEVFARTSGEESDLV